MERKQSSRSSLTPGANELKNKAQESVVSFGDSKNGLFRLRFGADDMELWADISPPRNPKDTISKGYAEVLLDNLNVTYGVDWDAVYAAIDTCNQDRKQVNNVLMARGKPPVNEVAEYFELNPALNQPASKFTDENKRIDYKGYTPFIIVKKDQILARRRPRIEGREGRNIHGDAIPYRGIKPQAYVGGKNTRTDDQYIYADIHGQLVENKRVLSVQNVLVIKNGVGYTTGNIVFPGDIIINGPVSDGFGIYSDGSVYIKQTFDVSNAVIKKNLDVSGGIIGRGRSLLKVGGTIKARFIDNCRLACRNDVRVVKEIVGSRIYTMGIVDMSEKGIIVGSSIYAMHGIRAGRIGTKFGKASRIHCGIDFTIMQNKERYTERLKRIALAVNQMRHNYDNAPDNEAGGAEREKLKKIIERLEEEQGKVSAYLSDLMARINADEQAAIEIHGEIVPNTFLEICQVNFTVTEPLYKVRVVLDTFLGTLVPKKIEK
jgi:uncharacterized protein (DUF342 family)